MTRLLVVYKYVGMSEWMNEEQELCRLIYNHIYIDHIDVSMYTHMLHQAKEDAHVGA